MRQIFMTYGFADANRMQQAAQRLTTLGYAVGNSRRVGFSLNIRVREGSADEEQVAREVASIQADAFKYPPAAPTMDLSPYREGLP